MYNSNVIIPPALDCGIIKLANFITAKHIQPEPLQICILVQTEVVPLVNILHSIRKVAREVIINSSQEGIQVCPSFMKTVRVECFSNSPGFCTVKFFFL